MAERKSLTKKTRFELFKRDNFTCQYCGSKAPEVVLEIDHIDPIANGGSNDLFNLITSCFSCNRGKSKNKLSDSSVLQKQRQKIEELNLRRQQLEMLLQWKTGLVDSGNEEAIKIGKYFCDKIPNTTYSVNETGLKTLKSVIKKYGFEKVLEACDLAFDKYYIGDSESFEIAFKKIKPILVMKEKPEYLQKIAYAKGILRNRIYINDSVATQAMMKYYSDGYCMDHLIAYCKTTNHWREFLGWIEYED